MKLSIGIVGMPNVGKSTLFKLLTNQNVDIANYPFCTIDPNVGIVNVPDERLDSLFKLEESNKKVPAIVEFYDIAGLVKGASEGQGLGNKFLNHIKETQVILMVLRCFKDDSIIHVENSVDPIRDLEIINSELILKDLETIERRLEKVLGEAKTGKKEAKEEAEILERIKNLLNQGKLIPDFVDEPALKDLNLLTTKKQLYLLNGNETDVSEDLKDKIKAEGGDYVISNLGELTNLDSLIKKSYEVLNLISFFTAGKDECRAWTIKKGWLAPQAAGVIHTDFENKFIRAEVLAYENYLEASKTQRKTGEAWQISKNKGWVKIEGKDYEVKDGDILVIRHS